MADLNSLLIEYCNDTENAEVNYNLANHYYALGQTAAALSFYLRAAERTSDKVLAYECMIYVALCFDMQRNRSNSVRGALKHAICILPNRPEAYFLLSRIQRSCNLYTDAYVSVEHAFTLVNFDNLIPLRTNVGYPGKYGLILEKAISAWWWGKVNECKTLLDDLVLNYWFDIPESDKQLIKTCYKDFNFLLPKNTRKIVDCFTYYDATCRELLELRYNVLKDHVDTFVVCEANRTQTGELIDRKLKQTLVELNLPLEKFEIVEVDIPETQELQILEIDKLNSYQNQNLESYQCRARERLQKNGLHQVLDKFDDNTYFIVSDCDEIIRPDVIEFVLNIVAKNKDKLIKIPLVHLEGRANLRAFRTDVNAPKPWDGAMFVCTKDHLKKATVIQIRSNIENPHNISYITQDNKRIEDLGWHFSWMGDASRRMAKLNGFVHRNEKLDFLETNSYDSKETLDRMQIEPAAGQMSISCEKNTILQDYPVELLPKVILDLPHLYEFFITGKMTSMEPLEILESEYKRACETQTDINKHLPILRSLAKECAHVTEMGVRDGQSTRSLLVEPVILRSYDLYKDANVERLFQLAKSAGKDVEYIEGDTLSITIDETDLLFIDTDHTYAQLSAELELHHNKARKYIAFHDTDKPYADELLPAIIEFMVKHPNWIFHYHTKECHGFTVIKRIG